MASKSSALFPSGVFFARGQVSMGIVTLLMQLSIVLWPTASRWASKSSQSHGVDRMLAELSEAHKIPLGHFQPKKRFTQVA
jgi:hypothetical protein